MVTEVEPAREYFKKKGIELIEIAVTSRETAAEEIKQELTSAVKSLRKIDPRLDNVLLWLSSSTAIFSNVKHVNQYAENIPVISSIPNTVKQNEDSAVLAIGIDRRNNAHLAALYAIDILTKGKKPGDLDVGIVSPPDISVNFLVAKKIGLKIPFKFVEASNFIYDYDGNIVRNFGKLVSQNGTLTQ
jgi:putative ABC transport system substrate-binding protein